MRPAARTRTRNQLSAAMIRGTQIICRAVETKVGETPLAHHLRALARHEGGHHMEMVGQLEILAQHLGGHGSDGGVRAAASEHPLGASPRRRGDLRCSPHLCDLHTDTPP